MGGGEQLGLQQQEVPGEREEMVLLVEGVGGEGRHGDRTRTPVAIRVAVGEGGVDPVRVSLARLHFHLESCPAPLIGADVLVAAPEEGSQPWGVAHAELVKEREAASDVERVKFVEAVVDLAPERGGVAGAGAVAQLEDAASFQGWKPGEILLLVRAERGVVEVVGVLEGEVGVSDPVDSLGGRLWSPGREGHGEGGDCQEVPQVARHPSAIVRTLPFRGPRAAAATRIIRDCGHPTGGLSSSDAWKS
jgi:hypothetical protein